MDIWPQIKERLKNRLDVQSYQRWFKQLELNRISDKKLTLEAPDQFSRDWLWERHRLLLEDIARSVDGKNRTVDIIVSEKKGEYPDSPTISPREPAVETRRALKLNPLYSFSNFVVGPGNRFAHAASLAVAESPAKAYNPLFIYGGVGLGKTHLMQAIGQYIYNRGHQGKISYTTSEIFTNELINSIQNRSTLRFRERYRNVDILLIDDIQFIAGKESTQEEFFHTFNTLYDAHRQIVISSDRPPKEIPGLEERLVSRFGWGLVTDIQPPNLETRIAILRKKAEAGNLIIEDEVTFFIADKIHTNIRELEGALIRVAAYSRLVGQEITVDLAKEVLKGILREEASQITVEVIKRRVVEYFKITLKEIHGRSRSRNVVFPRQIAIFLARETTNHSLPEIGGFFGGRDHTTILHACKKIEQELVSNYKTREIVEELRLRLKV